MNDLLKLYNDLEAFEQDFEKDSFTDETLAKMAFQEYINNCFTELSRSMQESSVH